jgi:hypothetical protein
MSVLLVTWDINKAEGAYSEARARFVAHLQTYQHVKDGGLDSVWFISTTQTPDQIDSYLRQKLDTNDRLVVTRMRSGEHQGWLDPSIWEWINAHL